MSNRIKRSNWRFPRSRFLENPGPVPPQARTRDRRWEGDEFRLPKVFSLCGKRAQPPSVRYAGRRFYVAPVFVAFGLLLPGSIDRA